MNFINGSNCHSFNFLSSDDDKRLHQIHKKCSFSIMFLQGYQKKCGSLLKLKKRKRIFLNWGGIEKDGNSASILFAVCLGVASMYVDFSTEWIDIKVSSSPQSRAGLPPRTVSRKIDPGSELEGRQWWWQHIQQGYEMMMMVEEKEKK